MRDEFGLTYRQRKFCDEYINNHGNATQAAIKAGYSENSAKVIGCENLLKSNLRQYMAIKAHEAAEKLGLDLMMTLANLKSGIERSARNIEVEIEDEQGNIKTSFNHDAANSMYKLICEAHKIIGAYPAEKEKDKVDDVNMRPVKEELDKCRNKF